MPYLKKAKKQRNPSNNRIERQKIYNTDRWHKLRASKLMQSPLCEVCLSKGVITPAFHIHHIDSFMNYEGMKRKEVAYNPDNLMSICEQCHIYYIIILFQKRVFKSIILSIIRI